MHVMVIEIIREASTIRLGAGGILDGNGDREVKKRPLALAEDSAIKSFLFHKNVREWRLAMNQQNDRLGTPATSQLPYSTCGERESTWGKN